MSAKRKNVSILNSSKFEVEDIENVDYLVPIDKNEDEDEEDNDSDYQDMTSDDEDDDMEDEGDDSSDGDGNDDEGNETKEGSEDEDNSSENEETVETTTPKTSNSVVDKVSAESTGDAKKTLSESGGEGQTDSLPEPDEYENDSSDEEDLRNTIGNVPINWYDEYPHIGYDLDGKQIIKPNRGDSLDHFLNRLENMDHDRMVLDKQTGQDVRLSDADLDVVQRIMGYKVADASYDYYAPWVDLYSHEVMEMPLSGRPEHKRSFIPSLREKEMVSYIVHKIKLGCYKQIQKREKKYLFNYDLWREDPEQEKLKSRIINPLPAPKEFKPGHTESYRPPPEFLFDAKQLASWERKMKRAADDPDFKIRGHNFVPKSFSSLRLVPGFKNFIKERFERCLDLYLAPRKKIYRCIAKTQDILPVLPKPKDLRPFPTMEEIKFNGHRSIVRSISIHPLGRYLASGSDDHTVKIWEISTGRCIKSFNVEGAVKCVSWNPHKELFLLAIVFDSTLVLLNPESYLVDKLVVQKTNSAFQAEPDQGDYIPPERISAAVTWRKATAEEWARGYRCVLTFFHELKEMVWHKQGDYFATLIPVGYHRAVMMHQLSRWRSQLPFNKSKGRVQAIQFHPKLPYLYVCTESHIRVYHLQQQKLLKKVQANSRHISSIAIHPGGEHFLIGTYDKRVTWFEMEYTRRPLVLRYHHQAVRKVAYHRKYPLFASASDDGRVIIAHGMVYNDLLKDPLLVPVKELGGHAMFDDYCVLDLAWHPYQPYLITAGADSTIRLWH